MFAVQLNLHIACGARWNQLNLDHICKFSLENKNNERIAINWINHWIDWKRYKTLCSHFICTTKIELLQFSNVRVDWYVVAKQIKPIWTQLSHWAQKSVLNSLRIEFMIVQVIIYSKTANYIHRSEHAK